MYDRTRPGDLSNAAYSLYLSEHGRILSEVLIDAGHGTMQSLIGSRNRIPECICLTHAHMDHTLSVDWLVQSHRRGAGNSSPYPVYASKPVFDSFLRSYPHLAEFVVHLGLEFGVTQVMEHAPGFRITAFPVYHGPSTPGASMFLFETEHRRVLFTGDLLSTLLRQKDLGFLSESDLVVTDANNRFPWPRTNHWSIAGHPEHWRERGPVLEEFVALFARETILAPYRGDYGAFANNPYYAELMEGGALSGQSFTLVEFLEKIQPRRVMPVHYSGAEDLRHSGESQLTRSGLGDWLENVLRKAGIGSKVIMAESGQTITIT